MAASEHVGCFYGMGVFTSPWGLRKHLEGKDFETNCFVVVIFGLVWFWYEGERRGKIACVSFEISTNVL